MKKTRIEIKSLIFNASEITVRLKKNINVIIVNILILSGIITGSIFGVMNFEVLLQSSLFNNYYSSFAGNLLSFLLIITFNFIMGLSIVGTPVISVNAILAGFYIGCDAVKIYMLYSDSSDIKLLISGIIRLLALSLIFSYSAENSYKMTEKLTKSILTLKITSLNLRRFLFSYLILLIACICISLLIATIL